MMATANQFAMDERILAKLQSVFADVIGKPTLIQSTDRIDKCMEQVLDADLCLDLGLPIETVFGITFPSEIWEGMGGDAPKEPGAAFDRWATENFTIQHLIDIVRDKLAAIELRPAVILGTACDQAGAFRAIEAVAKEIKPKLSRFGPSTPIYGLLRRFDIEMLWARLNWLTQERMEPLRATWASKLSQKLVWELLLTLGLMFIALGVSEWTDDDTYSIDACSSAAIALVIALVAWPILYRVDNPLPLEIKTFRDLSEFVAKQM